jgi:hypothetical protein
MTAVALHAFVGQTIQLLNTTSNFSEVKLPRECSLEVSVAPVRFTGMMSVHFDDVSAPGTLRSHMVICRSEEAGGVLFQLMQSCRNAVQRLAEPFNSLSLLIDSK